MRYQKLGNSDLEVSVIGLGCATLSGLYGDYDANEAPLVFDAAFEHGINFLDTSEIYGAQGLVQGIGHNERMIADAIRGRRDGLIIATKFGHIFDENDDYAIDARPERVEPSCDDCLGRLGVDVIDLFYLHRVDANTPIEDTVGAMSRLVEKGKVRYLGLSEASPDTLSRGHATTCTVIAQRPLNSGLRFSTKARWASRASSVLRRGRPSASCFSYALY